MVKKFVFAGKVALVEACLQYVLKRLTVIGRIFSRIFHQCLFASGVKTKYYTAYFGEMRREIYLRSCFSDYWVV